MQSVLVPAALFPAAVNEAAPVHPRLAAHCRTSAVLMDALYLPQLPAA